MCTRLRLKDMYIVQDEEDVQKEEYIQDNSKEVEEYKKGMSTRCTRCGTFTRLSKCTRLSTYKRISTCTD